MAASDFIFTSFIQKDGSLPVRAETYTYKHPVLIGHSDETVLWPSLELRSDIVDSVTNIPNEGDPLVYSEIETPVRVFYVDTSIDPTSEQTGSAEKPFSSINKVFQDDTIECLCTEFCCFSTKVVIRVRGVVSEPIYGRSDLHHHFNNNLLIEPWLTDRIIFNYTLDTLVEGSFSLISNVDGVIFKNFDINLFATNYYNIYCFHNINSVFLVNCNINISLSHYTGLYDNSSVTFIYIGRFVKCAKTNFFLEDINDTVHDYTYSFLNSSLVSSDLLYDCDFEISLTQQKRSITQYLNCDISIDSEKILAASHLNFKISCRMDTTVDSDNNTSNFRIYGLNTTFAYDINYEISINTTNYAVNAYLLALKESSIYTIAYGDSITIETSANVLATGEDSLSYNFSAISLPDSGILKNVTMHSDVFRLETSYSLDITGISTNSIGGFLPKLSNLEININANNIYAVDMNAYISGIHYTNRCPELVNTNISVNSNYILTEENSNLNATMFSIEGVDTIGGPISNVTATASVNLDSSLVTDPDSNIAFASWCFSRSDLSDISYNVTHDDPICKSFPADKKLCENFKCF